MSPLDPTIIAKYLSGSVTEQAHEYKAEEAFAVLHSVRLALHLFPKTVYAFSLLAKSRVQQTAKRAQAVLLAVPTIYAELQNPPDASPDLGQLASIRDYLKLLKFGTSSQVLAGLATAERLFAASLRTALVRTGTGWLERTRPEAILDLHDALSVIEPLCASVDTSLSDLTASIDAWDSLPREALHQEVTDRALGGVSQVLHSSRFGEISPTVAFLETRAAVLAAKAVRVQELLSAPAVAPGTITYSSAVATSATLRDSNGVVLASLLPIEAGDVAALGGVQVTVTAVGDSLTFGGGVPPATNGSVTIQSGIALLGRDVVNQLRLPKVAETLCATFKADSIQYSTSLSDQDRTKAMGSLTVLLAHLTRITDVAAYLPEVSYTQKARAILTSLEDRGMDRAADLLLAGNLPGFWSLTPDRASYGRHMMTAIEQVGRRDYAEPSLAEDELERRAPPDAGNNLQNVEQEDQ